MRNFLEEALEQERDENEDMEREIPFEFHSAGGKALGASFAQKRSPGPQKAPGGESFDSRLPRLPTLKDRGKGSAGTLPLGRSTGFSNVRSFAPAAYDLTPPGVDRRGVLTERLQAPRAGGEGQGQGREIVGRAAEIPLMTALRRAERTTAFVQGSGRRLTVSLPESVGGECAGLSVEELDRVVERDARRYDGGSVFY